MKSLRTPRRWIVALLILGIVGGQWTARASDHTNVVFILVDDLGYMDIGANNPETFYETPNIDRLARGGMRFTNGYAANPVCSPTRYSIMTGRHPTRADVTNFFCGRRGGRFAPAPLQCELPSEEVTLAQALKDGGYATFFAGKWHLGSTAENWPENRGFDINRGGHRAGGPFKAGKYFSPYANPRLEDGPKGEHLPDRLAMETVRFIESHADEKFLAYLSFYSVHTPLMAPEPLVAKYRAKAARLKREGQPDFAEEEQVWQRPAAADASKNAKKRKVRDPGPRRVRIRQNHAVYAAMVEAMDRNVGRVLDALDRRGLSKNTAVFIMSDNGGLSTSEGSPTSNLPLRGGKGWLYEGGIREPYIVRWPGETEPGSTSDVPVVSMDFYPTILEIVGLPKRPSQHLDGKSLVDVLRGGSSLERDALYWHYPHYSNQGGFPGAAIRVGDWKLIERFEDGRVHLYDLKSDIGERKDLAQKERQRVDAMRARLHGWYRQVDAKFLQPKSNGPTPWRPE